MFTGIVQGMGKITDIAQPSPDFRTHTVDLPPEIADNLQTGASVANNGCCLTITRIDGNKVSFDLMDETLRKTNLGSLKVGDSVNLERAARFGDEIGGHVMSGHVMAVTRISRIDSSEFNRTVWFELPENLKPYILTKGFVGLDGCSLTIGEVSDSEFCVHLIRRLWSVPCLAAAKKATSSILKSSPQTQAVVDTVMRVLAQKAV